VKVYVMTDLEGVAGIINFDDYGTPKGRYYETARELTTNETNAAIEGLIEDGAKEILVVDGHGHGAINPSLLHPTKACELIRERAKRGLERLSEIKPF